MRQSAPRGIRQQEKYARETEGEAVGSESYRPSRVRARGTSTERDRGRKGGFRHRPVRSRPTPHHCPPTLSTSSATPPRVPARPSTHLAVRRSVGERGNAQE